MKMLSKIRKIRILSTYDVSRIFPERDISTHKGDYGKVMLLCGSVGYTGAAILSAKAACRCGSGLVYLCVPKSIYQIVASQLSEPVITPLEDNGCGHFIKENFEEIKTLLSQMDALLIGPGCGRSDDLLSLVREILAYTDIPVILDADAINVFSADPSLLSMHQGPLVLTPHDGEFYRVYRGEKTDRLSEAICFAIDNNCVVVRKGYHSLITDGHIVYQNSSGNPGMAKGGSGDVLSGILLSVLGRNSCIPFAAACAVFLHGACGDLAAIRLGQEGMLPSDMISFLPYAIRKIKLS